MEPETRYAKSGAHRIAYQVTGAGPDLVMVPGLTSHLDIQWRDPGYRRFVRAMSSFCRLVRFDKRGTGLSDPVAGPPALDERVADLLAVDVPLFRGGSVHARPVLEPDLGAGPRPDGRHRRARPRRRRGPG